MQLKVLIPLILIPLGKYSLICCLRNLHLQGIKQEMDTQKLDMKLGMDHHEATTERNNMIMNNNITSR